MQHIRCTAALKYVIMTISTMMPVMTMMVSCWWWCLWNGDGGFYGWRRAADKWRNYRTLVLEPLKYDDGKDNGER